VKRSNAVKGILECSICEVDTFCLQSMGMQIINQCIDLCIGPLSTLLLAFGRHQEGLDVKCSGPGYIVGGRLHVSCSRVSLQVRFCHEANETRFQCIRSPTGYACLLPHEWPSRMRIRTGSNPFQGNEVNIQNHQDENILQGRKLQGCSFVYDRRR
jgi:hypothetical protein